MAIESDLTVTNYDWLTQKTEQKESSNEFYEFWWIKQISANDEKFLVANPKKCNNICMVANIYKKTTYYVSFIGDDVYSCSCPDYYFRVHNGSKSKCKHQLSTEKALKSIVNNEYEKL